MFMKTADKQGEAAKVFDMVVDHFPDMIHSVDAEGNIVYVNRMATVLLDYTTDELYAMNIRQLYSSEILDAVERGFREVKQTGEKRVESLLRAKDGTRIPVEMRTLAIHDEHGAFAQTFTVSRDMRKQKEMQDSLIHSGRLAAIGELAAGVVHDLNNPLTAIILASAVMGKVAGDPAASPAQLREQSALFCETIRESAVTMEALTSRLRDFARGVKEQHKPVDLFDTIHDALFILAHRIRHNNVRVTCPIVKARHWALGDRNQIEQVFLNIFANACDAMAQSGTRELTVEVDALTEGPCAFWCCTVRDTRSGRSRGGRSRRPGGLIQVAVHGVDIAHDKLQRQSFPAVISSVCGSPAPRPPRSAARPRPAGWGWACGSRRSPCPPAPRP
jgi:PAS domain S-box-containing protein